MSYNIKVRGPTSMVNLSLSPNITYKEFITILSQELKIPDSCRFDVLYGYPPKVLQCENHTLLQEFLTNNETIRVQSKELAGQQIQGTSIIKQKKKNTITKMNDSSSLSPYNTKIHSIKTLASSDKSFQVQPSKKPKTTNTDDSHVIIKRRRKSTKDAAKSEHDICEHLINAVNGGSTDINKALRKVFRNAIELQYNSTKAIDRLNAIYSNSYNIQECTNAYVLGTGSCTQIEVTYHKGVGTRSNHIEVVDLLPSITLIELLKIASETDSELLKPINLSKCSPRIFWSLIYHYGNNIQATIKNQLSNIGIIIDNISWLDERKKELSEKAKENLLQQEEKVKLTLERKAKKNKEKISGICKVQVVYVIVVLYIYIIFMKENNSIQNQDMILSSSKLIQEQEDDIKNMLLNGLNDKNVLHTNNISFIPNEWYLPLLNYLKIDKQNITMIIALANLECNSKTRNELVQMKLSTEIKPNIVTTNYHEKTNSNTTTSSLINTKPTTATNTSNTPNNSNNIAYSNILSLDLLDCWINNAQFEVLHYLWRYICGGGSLRLRNVLEKLRIKTPKEMKIWKNAPDGLYEGICELDEGIQSIHYNWYDSYHHRKINTDLIMIDSKLNDISTSSSSSSSSNLTLDKVIWMCNVCDIALTIYPWLDSYLLPYDHNDEINNDEDIVDEDNNNNISIDDMEWCYQPSDHCYITCRVRLLIDHLNYWEDGVVFAYLPPNEVETMALWKVKLDNQLTLYNHTSSNHEVVHSSSNSSGNINKSSISNVKISNIKDRFEDLEEHEVKAAIDLWNNKNNTYN